MKRAILLACAVAGATAAAARAETWKHVPVVDTVCYSDVKDAPDEHSRECALQCVEGGYGLVTPEGEFLRFDEAGNRSVAAALEASEREKGLRATVVGERRGDTVSVASVTIE